MKLSFEQIEKIAQGVSYITSENGDIQFHRFTPEQEAYYNVHALHPREYVTAGVTLNFKTDSTRLTLKVNVEYGTPSEYFAHEIFANGKKIGVLSNFTEADLPIEVDLNTMLPIGDFKHGAFEGEYYLGDGIKEIEIVFPWSVISKLKELSLDDDSMVEAVKPPCRMLFYGDSITYGASAVYPSNRYAHKTASMMNCEEICKGIGGEIFCPGIIVKEENIDYILVAYGTNEYDMSAFKTRCEEFFEKLTQTYPDTTIIALTPLWRKECDTDINSLKRIQTIQEHIMCVTEQYDNVVCIRGYDLVPHDSIYFADLSLHPNDMGFEHYVKNLVDEINKKI